MCGIFIKPGDLVSFNLTALYTQHRQDIVLRKSEICRHIEIPAEFLFKGYAGVVLSTKGCFLNGRNPAKQKSAQRFPLVQQTASKGWKIMASRVV